MKIGIVGYGQMGKMIQSILVTKGIKHVTIDKNEPTADFKTIEQTKDQDIDVYIDFTIPDTAIDNIKTYCKIKKNVVMGTTGWYDNIADIEDMILDAGIGFIYASNFSIGVNVFFRIIEYAAKIMDKFQDYDVYGLEYHHNKKLDSPSGTAKSIAEILVNNIQRKNIVHFDRFNRRPGNNELHFASVRAGSIPGTHLVGFDSEADTIELKHVARSRQGFTAGAVFAAEWIKDKVGFFTKEDMMNTILGETE